MFVPKRHMAIYYELNGKTIILSLEEYLNLDDESIQNLIAEDRGLDINDPFTNLRVKDYDKLKSDNLSVQELSDEEVEEIRLQMEKENGAK